MCEDQFWLNFGSIFSITYHYKKVEVDRKTEQKNTVIEWRVKALTLSEALDVVAMLCCAVVADVSA